MSMAGAQDVRTETDAELRQKADRLAHELLLLDTHLDTPFELQKRMQDISGRIEGGHFDYVRARQGGLDALFLAVYVSADYEEKGGARAYADQTIDLVESFPRRWPDKFALLTSIAQIRAQFGSGRVVLLLGLENGSALEGDLANVQHFHERGVRYITLCHSKNNRICDSSFDDAPKWHGLSPFGRELIGRMNRVGMMIDVSHVSDEALSQVLELSQAPVVATHSACRHFTPGWHRNLSDDLIRRLAAQGGVIQVNFGAMFVNSAVNAQFEKRRDEIQKHIHTNNLQGAERSRYIEQRWREQPLAKAHVRDVADHIEHVVKLVGVDHVGFGSDFDGVTEVPAGLEDVSAYPNLIYELLKRGYGASELRKICAENFLRAWAAVEKAGAAPRQP
ncbi:MAG: dipeptidase [Planctomycetes bacterium]|nr:dipeptidase [Planctomycetota bacterium]